MEMGDNTMLWKGTELRNSSCSKESDKSLEELNVADLKALMDYLDRYVMYEEGFAAVHEEWEKRLVTLKLAYAC